MNLFSVIIPTFNRVDLISMTLDSIASQTCRDFEVIVVDDGSTDETKQVSATYPFVRYLRQDNAGPGAARNLGIEHATGRYVAFLDSDDVWFPWTLSTYKAAIQAGHEPSLVIGSPQYFASPTELVETGTIVSYDRYPDLFSTTKRTCFYGTGGTVVLRDELMRVGRFSHLRINGEDLDLLLRLGTAPECVIVDGIKTFGYRRHSASEIGSIVKTVAGLTMMIQNEQSGQYPGDVQRQRERRELLTRFIRPHILDAIRQNYLSAGWKLYCLTVIWHLSLRRYRFLIGTPLIALCRFLPALPSRKRPPNDGLVR